MADAPFGGTIINQQKEPAPASTAAKRASILATIMRVESGGRNIPQAIHDVNTDKGTPAQGYFQIINPTWSRFGGDKTPHKSAIDAPYEIQRQVALGIPVEHWGPATQQALKAAGYEPQPGETLGAMLARYKEDPNATRPEDVGGVTSGGTATASSGFDLSGLYGLLAGRKDTTAEDQQRLALLEEQKQQAASTGLMKQGMGLLGAADVAAPQMSLQAPGIVRPQQRQPITLGGGTDFEQALAQQRLMRRA